MGTVDDLGRCGLEETSMRFGASIGEHGESDWER